ncbi:protein of unknown function DUF169 [Desulfarculus baarsii DSM 2075]|uniref:DUF169 domain-containing protein n=1 Tax=Desulfarculus baarsii (strain ATCC 33931 / DSM 2075 / LMG 7858 / VKM B-1802 / 2st14) TaxID=644282 RepID=E1QJU8_DESB2|nr:DUF169 domain-containing protein [Desulfarculus baarsii]ADK85841.1 protein of unknown function DUF169 [Desulfarculus baarsii DSM 2075]
MGCKEYDQVLTKLIRPQTHPLAIKILGPDDEPAANLDRPDNYGIQVAVCQWVTMARRWGRPMSVLAGDVNCSPCLASLGLKRMRTASALADYFMEMGYFAAKELALKAAEKLDPIPHGKIKGLAIYPLSMAESEPDLVVIYGNPAQMARLASAFVHFSGEFVQSATTGFGISCLSMLKPHFSGKPAIVVPGRGERILAGAEEGEMYCSFPFGLMEQLLDSLEQTQNSGSRYPFQRYVLFQPPLTPAFANLNQALE